MLTAATHTTPTRPSFRCKKWADIAERVDLGLFVYYRRKEWPVVKFRDKYAIMDAKTGEILVKNVNSMDEPPQSFFYCRGEAPDVEAHKSADTRLCPGDGRAWSEKQEAKYDDERRRHRLYFKDGMGEAHGKRMGKANSRDDIGKYVNRRGTFTVDEFAAIHDRFKAHALESHRAAMERLKK